MDRKINTDRQKKKTSGHLSINTPQNYNRLDCTLGESFLNKGLPLELQIQVTKCLRRRLYCMTVVME